MRVWHLSQVTRWKSRCAQNLPRSVRLPAVRSFLAWRARIMSMKNSSAVPSCILLCQNHVDEKNSSAAPSCILVCQNHVDKKLLSCPLLHIVTPESCRWKLLSCPLLHIIMQESCQWKTPLLSPPAHCYARIMSMKNSRIRNNSSNSQRITDCHII